MAPNIAQGANMAIESAAGLANGLHRLLQTNGQARPSETDIICILEGLSHTLYAQAKAINTFSQAATRMLARDGFIYTFLGRYIAFRPDFLMGLGMYKILAGGITLDYIPPGSVRPRCLKRARDPAGRSFAWLALILVLFLWMATIVCS